MIKNKGIVFWITGLSGSGKTTIGKAIKLEIKKKFGPTILVNGDDIRKIFKFKTYEKKNRLTIAKQYNEFCNFISKQNINLIFTTVALFDSIHEANRKKIKNYFEIYIESDFKKIIKKRNKRFYKMKTKNVWGVDLKPEFPKKPDVKILNDFSLPIKKLKRELLNRIFDKLI
jgi:adenylylsulfate kinase-like enzyme